MREMLLDPRRAAPAAGVKAFHHEGPADRRLLDIEPVDIELVVVFGIGDRRLQHLLDVVRDAAARRGSACERWYAWRAERPRPRYRQAGVRPRVCSSQLLLARLSPACP